MSDPVDGPLIVTLPDRVDRRLSLGPFPSAREALKFAGYAAAGAPIVPWVGALGWLPFVVAGFVVATVRPGGRGLDARMADWLAYRFRRAAGPAGVQRRSVRLSHGFVRVSPGRFAVVIRAEGIPLSFLPPEEHRQRFERYREVIRAARPSFAVVATSIPIDEAAVAPARSPLVDRESDGEAAARRAYEELSRLLARRRRHRRVYFALFGDGATADTLRSLEGRATRVVEGLAGLGVSPTRLYGPALERAARSFGWATGGPT